jgi:hypothetical protein
MPALPSLGVRRARRVAQSFLCRYRIAKPTDLSIEAIASMARLEVQRGTLTSATARLARVGRFGTIRVTDRIAHQGAHRFSVAHELGHFALAHPTAESEAPCDDAPTRTEIESEANAFAAELLMPEAMLRRRCEVSPVSLDPARAIAEDFQVSLMAAAMRFVELTSERCALVFARDRRVSWVVRSQTFTPFVDRGRRLDPASVAFDAFDRGRVIEGCQPVAADAWLDHERASEVEIYEDAVMLTELRGVMSLLWIPEHVAAPFDRD